MCNYFFVYKVTRYFEEKIEAKTTDKKKLEHATKIYATCHYDRICIFNIDRTGY